MNNHNIIKAILILIAILIIIDLNLINYYEYYKSLIAVTNTIILLLIIIIIILICLMDNVDNTTNNYDLYINVKSNINTIIHIIHTKLEDINNNDILIINEKLNDIINIYAINDIHVHRDVIINEVYIKLINMNNNEKHAKIKNTIEYLFNEV
jgi:glucan phosphoethanolaminetransferase (alkaline phosphatase superfamily)